MSSLYIRQSAQYARAHIAQSVSTALGWLQVLRYGLGQEYKRHMDTLHDDDAGPRVCTILMYLNGKHACMPACVHTLWCWGRACRTSAWHNGDINTALDSISWIFAEAAVSGTVPRSVTQSRLSPVFIALECRDCKHAFCGCDVCGL
jgi:hypothetical protein